MRHPFALTAELVMRGRKPQTAPRFYAPRPSGELVWLHVGLPSVASMLAPLADRLLSNRPELGFLVTAAPGIPDPARDHPALTGAGEVPDTAAEAKAFLAHFRPDLGLWAGGELGAPMLAAAAETDLPMALVAAQEDGVPAAGFRWRSSVTAALLKTFSACYAETANAERRLAAYGLDPAVLHLVGPMQQGLTPPGCNEDDLDSLREALSGRTLWAALGVTADEVPLLLEAHLRSSRFDPRALLILQPDGADALEALGAALALRPLAMTDWDAGEMPGEPSQLLLSRTGADAGLWHRLAPVSFLGGTLAPDRAAVSPWAAAALGSAILCGPHVETHRAAYDRLRDAGAARIVQSVADLATALSQLAAPDRAAAMAHAGWQVATTGAEATDRVVDLVMDILDTGERH